MTSVEQHKLISELREYSARMTREEADMFEMFHKRDRDDEDLDELSKKKLRALHEKYIRSRATGRNPLDALFGRRED